MRGNNLKFYCELNYHDQKIDGTPTHNIWEHWTAVSTLLGLISSVYSNLHHWRSNQRPQIAVPKLHCWWDLIRSNSCPVFLYIVRRCSVDFLVMVIQFTILIPLLKKIKICTSKFYVLCFYVTYWPLTELSIKRCTCVNKQRNSGNKCIQSRMLEYHLDLWTWLNSGQMRTPTGSR